MCKKYDVRNELLVQKWQMANKDFEKMLSKVWDEITYPFPNFNGATVEVWEWINDVISHSMIDVITYLCWN